MLTSSHQLPIISIRLVFLPDGDKAALVRKKTPALKSESRAASAVGFMQPSVGSFCVCMETALWAALSCRACSSVDRRLSPTTLDDCRTDTRAMGCLPRLGCFHDVQKWISKREEG